MEHDHGSCKMKELGLFEPYTPAEEFLTLHPPLPPLLMCSGAAPTPHGKSNPLVSALGQEESVHEIQPHQVVSSGSEQTGSQLHTSASPTIASRTPIGCPGLTSCMSASDSAPPDWYSNNCTQWCFLQQVMQRGRMLSDVGFGST